MFKKRIGITQRVMQHPRHTERMDCLDTKWAKLLLPLGILPVPLPLLPETAALAAWNILKLDGLILSGGNTLVQYADESDAPENLSPQRDAYEQALLKAAISTHTPVLGVCRGLQVINSYYKGGLIKASGHAGTRHPLFLEKAASAFSLPLEVNSFHDCVVPRSCLGKELIPLACDTEGYIEALYHPQDKVFGIMWHPEREEPPLQQDCQLVQGHFGL